MNYARTRFARPVSFKSHDGFRCSRCSDEDGNVWVTEQAGNKLAKFDTGTEEFTEFEVPTEDSHPTQLAIDSDGIIWVLEILGNKLARFDPATGEFQERESKHENAKPDVPTTTSKGRVGWTEKGTDPHHFNLYKPEQDTIENVKCDPGQVRTTAIARPDMDYDLFGATSFENRITVIDPYPYSRVTVDIPTPSAGPHGFAIGPDGNGWFTERYGNKIGKINLEIIDRSRHIEDQDTENLEITEFDIPTRMSRTLDLEFDDENELLWFAEVNTRKIGVLDPRDPEPMQELSLPARQTTTPQTTSATNSATTSTSVPGFGLGAAATGMVGAALVARRLSRDD